MSAAADAMLRRATFAYRCQGVEFVGGTPYMRDSGPHGLHAEMSNFGVAPYGLTTLGQRNAIAFNGTTQYATAPFRFYDHAPTDDLTFVAYGSYAGAATNDPLFDCRAGGVAAGIKWRFYNINAANAFRLDIDSYDAAGNLGQVYDSAFEGRLEAPYVTVMGRSSGSLVARSWLDGHERTTGVVYRTPPNAYLTTEPVRICTYQLITFTPCVLGFLGLFPWVFDARDERDIRMMLLDGAI